MNRFQSISSPHLQRRISVWERKEGVFGRILFLFSKYDNHSLTFEKFDQDLATMAFYSNLLQPCRGAGGSEDGPRVLGCANEAASSGVRKLAKKNKRDSAARGKAVPARGRPESDRAIGNAFLGIHFGSSHSLLISAVAVRVDLVIERRV